MCITYVYNCIAVHMYLYCITDGGLIGSRVEAGKDSERYSGGMDICITERMASLLALLELHQWPQCLHLGLVGYRTIDLSISSYYSSTISTLPRVGHAIVRSLSRRAIACRVSPRRRQGGSMLDELIINHMIIIIMIMIIIIIVRDSEA